MGAETFVNVGHECPFAWVVALDPGDMVCGDRTRVGGTSANGSQYLCSRSSEDGKPSECECKLHNGVQCAACTLASEWEVIEVMRTYNWKDEGAVKF